MLTLLPKSHLVRGGGGSPLRRPAEARILWRGGERGGGDDHLGGCGEEDVGWCSDIRLRSTIFGILPQEEGEESFPKSQVVAFSLLK